MIKMKNKLLAFAFAVACVPLMAQQNSEEIEEISLPDVSTVISGGAPKVGKSAVPDYSQVLPHSNKNEELLPVLPGSGEVASPNVDAVASTGNQKKNVYAEGTAGAGFPGYIIGDFSLYRQSGKNPFLIKFSHETANGYSGHSFTSGYFDRKTSFYADKTFSSDKMDFTFFGSYENMGNGFQDKIPGMTDVSKDRLNGELDWTVRFTKDVSMNLSAEGSWYKRYSTTSRYLPDGLDFYKLVETSEMTAAQRSAAYRDYAQISELFPEVEGFLSNVAFLNLSPELKFRFENSKKFYTEFSAAYGIEYDIKNSFDGTRAIHRGDFGVALGWSNRFINIYGNSAAIIGNEIGNHAVVVPFTVGADFSIKNAMSDRPVALSIKGGIDSYLPKVEMLECRFGFSALNVLPAETSDWYGQLDLALPVKDFFTFALGGEFRTTAYDNGTWEPDYDKEHKASGQYLYDQNVLTQINSDVAFRFHVKAFSLSAGWKNYWIDVPELESRCSFTFGISVQDKNARVGFEGLCIQNAAPSDDRCPEVNLSMFWRLTNAVRLAVAADDVVKLICGSERVYAGDYIARSGTASVQVRFFF